MKKDLSNEFFKMLAIETRTSDVSAVRAAYFGLCRLILKNLVLKQEIELPEFCTFKVKHHGSRRIMNVQTCQHQITRESATVKFIPNLKLRYYIDEKLGPSAKK